MKRLLLVATLLASLAPQALHTAYADSARIQLAPGITLHLGDRDRHGHYWDGGRWRDTHWWRNNYRYDDGRWWRHEQWRRHQQMLHHHQWERERRWRQHGHHHQWRPHPPVFRHHERARRDRW